MEGRGLGGNDGKALTIPIEVKKETRTVSFVKARPGRRKHGTGRGEGRGKHYSVEEMEGCVPLELTGGCRAREKQETPTV